MTDVNSVLECGSSVGADGDQGESLGLDHGSLPSWRRLTTRRLPPGLFLDDGGGSYVDPGGLDELPGGWSGNPLLDESQG